MKSSGEKTVALKVVRIVFYLFLLTLLVVSLYPPVYLSFSGHTGVWLGLPGPVFYWTAIPSALFIGLGLFYLCEKHMGEFSFDEVIK